MLFGGFVLFSLKKRLLHAILTCIGSFVVCLRLLVFRNLLHDLHFLLFAGGVVFLIVRGTSFTELSGLRQLCGFLKQNSSI